jgi:GH25 family lysozyme M1 (1,4-beta-N-acetylmuramidase)
MSRAIDISGYDGRRYDDVAKKYVYDQPMDWVKARDEGGIAAAMIKCSEAKWEDGAFKMNWRGAKGILPRIAWHFFRSNVNAIEQANFVWDLMQREEFDPKTDFIALDYETTDGVPSGQSLAYAGSCLYQWEKRGVLPWIYTGTGSWNGLGTADQRAGFKRYPLWLAQWQKDTWVLGFAINVFDAPKLDALIAQVETGFLKPTIPAPWTSLAAWQITSRAQTKAIPGHPGIKPVADYNIVYATLPAVTPPVPPPAVPWNMALTNWARTKGYSGPDPS